MQFLNLTSGVILNYVGALECQPHLWFVSQPVFGQAPSKHIGVHAAGHDSHETSALALYLLSLAFLLLTMEMFATVWQ